MFVLLCELLVFLFASENELLVLGDLEFLFLDLGLEFVELFFKSEDFLVVLFL